MSVFIYCLKTIIYLKINTFSTVSAFVDSSLEHILLLELGRGGRTWDLK